MRLSGLFNVVGRYDDGPIEIATQTHQMVPDSDEFKFNLRNESNGEWNWLNVQPFADEWIDADSWFVEDEQLGIVKQGDGEWNATLLAATQRFDVAITGR